MLEVIVILVLSLWILFLELRSFSSPPDTGREELMPGRDHLTIHQNFQSDKFPWCHAGFVPLKLTDQDARDLLRAYARRRGRTDKQFERDLLEALDHPPVRPPMKTLKESEYPGRNPGWRRKTRER